VTAVTTAGLLAGLFGSAFVPAVRAGAALNPALTSVACTGADNTGTVTDNANTCTWVSTVAPVITTTYTLSGVDIGTYSFALASTNTLTNYAVSDSGAGTATYATTLVGNTLNVNVTANAGVRVIVVTLNLAKASTGKVTITSPSGTAASGRVVTVASIASAKAGKSTAYTSVAADQTTTRTLNDDVTAANTANAAADHEDTSVNGTSTVNNSVDYITASHVSANADTGSYEVAYTIKDAYGGAVDISAKQFTATTTCGGVDIGAASADADDEPGVTSSVAVGAADGSLFVTVDHPGADKGCVATVTVTELATGVVIDTWSIGFLGETASLTLTGPKYLAANLTNDTDLEDQITVVAKDKNGIVRPGLFADPTFTVTDELGVDIAETFVDDNATNGGVLSDNIWDLDNAVCAADKEGKTRTIYAEGETLVATGKTKSNVLTITCTGKLAYVSAIAFEKTSYYPSEAATVVFTMKDSAGRVAGVGSYMSNAGFAMTNSPANAAGGSATTEPATTIVSATLAGILVVEDGIYEFDYVMGTAAGVAGFLFDIADNDGVTALSQQGLFTVKTVVTSAFAAVSDATISAGAKKKIATATFGAAAGKKVAFVLENASGVTKTYYRKANASGVAKYTIALRGTWTVYATFGDEITDTVTLRK
jgi:hypothetical protein